MEEKVSIEAARAQYGVVIDPITKNVDVPATDALRRRLGSHRSHRCTGRMAG